MRGLQDRIVTTFFFMLIALSLLGMATIHMPRLQRFLNWVLSVMIGLFIAGVLYVLIWATP